MSRNDLRMQAVALRDAVSRHASAPAADAPGPAALAVWEAIVKPRLAPRAAALERLADAGAWVLDDEDRAIGLIPERWDEAIAALGDLYAALTEAAHLYRGLRFEIPAAAAAKPAQGAGTSVGKRTAGKKTAGRKKGGRARVPPPATSPAGAAHLDPALTAGVAEDRGALEAGPSVVQALMARIQKAEEDRLKPDCEVCFEGDRATAEQARALFQRMRVGRLNAESFAGTPPERYGALLREGWRQPHLEVLTLLGLAPAVSPEPPPPPAAGRRDRPAGP